MNVLFLTIGQIDSLKKSSVHIDVIKALRKKGHNVSVLCTIEKQFGDKTLVYEEDGVKIVRLKIGNITRCSIIEKGINTVLIESEFIKGLKKYFNDDKFDLVIYNTPPITFANTVKYCKKKYHCKSYLMLKDIFPQNAVDIGILSKSGIKGLLYKMFRHKEHELYKVSDRIGCMSQGNVKYLLENNPEIDKTKVEIFPNSVYDYKKIEKSEDKSVLEKYGIDKNKLTFIYGGNLGKPQGLNFLVEGIKACRDLDCNFIIIGSGALKDEVFENLKGVENAYTFDFLPQEEYIKFCSLADVGMLMLDYRFTIPNYPSRILSYMENAMPVFACTDKVTDIKELVESEAKCGRWCYSNNLEDFRKNVEWFVNNKDKLEELGNNGKKYLEEYFNAVKNVECLERMVGEDL